VLTKHWKPLENIWPTLDLDHYNWRNLLEVRQTFAQKRLPKVSSSPPIHCPYKPQTTLKIFGTSFYSYLMTCYKGGTPSSGIVTLTLLKLLLELVHSLTIQLNTSNYRLTSGSWEISCNKLESPTHCFFQLDPLGLWMSQHKLRTNNFILPPRTWPTPNSNDSPEELFPSPHLSSNSFY